MQLRDGTWFGLSSNLGKLNWAETWVNEAGPNCQTIIKAMNIDEIEHGNLCKVQCLFV